MVVGDAYVFSGFLTPVLTQLFLPKPQTTFLTCFCIGERLKYAGKESRLKWGSNSQPPGHESDTLTTEPPRRGSVQGKEEDKQNEKKKLMIIILMLSNISVFLGKKNYICFSLDRGFWLKYWRRMFDLMFNSQFFFQFLLSIIYHQRI